MDKIKIHTGRLLIDNQVLDLSTLEYKSVNDEETKKFLYNIPVTWKGINYNTEFIDNYIKTLFNGDNVKSTEFQKLLGSILLRKPRYRTVIIQGSGSNGKTTFMSFLEKLLGRYIYRSFGLSVKDNYNKNMAEAMIIYMPEGAENYLTQEDYVFLTSNYITVNKQDNDKCFEGNIVHSLFFCTNDKVSLPTYWLEHCVVFNFPQVFTSNVTLLEDLEGHVEELLVWLVKGCLLVKK